MNLDYKVILTNIIGFVIVVWVLKKYAWKPILDLLDSRRDKISDDFAKAETARDEAQKLQGEFESKLGDIKTLERERVQEAVRRGEDIADRIKTEARQKADAQLDKARQDIDIESQQAQIVLRDKVVELALGAAAKVVGKELDEDSHRRLIREYIDNLEDLAGETPHA